MTPRRVGERATRLLVVLLPGIALAGASPAPDPRGPVPARELRRAVATGWWPAGVAADLDSGGTTRQASITGLSRDVVAGPVHGPVSGPLPPAPDPTASPAAPGASRAPAVPPALVAEAQGLERGIRELNGLAIELDHAGTDLLGMQLAKGGRELVRPFLLFLVERGVLRADEVDRFLESDLAEVLARLRDRIAATHDRRAALEVQRYLLLQRTGELDRAEGGRR